MPVRGFYPRTPDDDRFAGESARRNTVRIDEVLDHVVAPIIYHILYGDQELTLDYCHALLDRLQWRPTAAAPPDPAAATRASRKQAGRRIDSGASRCSAERRVGRKRNKFSHRRVDITDDTLITDSA